MLTEEIVIETGNLEIRMGFVIVVHDRQQTFKSLLDDFDVATNELVGIVDLVADAADQLAQGGQLVGLLKLLLIGFLIGDIPKKLDDSIDLVLLTKNRHRVG